MYILVIGLPSRVYVFVSLVIPMDVVFVTNTGDQFMPCTVSINIAYTSPSFQIIQADCLVSRGVLWF